MGRKQLSMIAAVCAAVAVIAVFLPWYSVSMDLGPLHRSDSLNGTEGNYMGGLTLVLALIGGAAALIVGLGRAKATPLDERQLLFVAIGGLGIGSLLTLIDLTRGQSGEGAEVMEMAGVSAGRSIGLFLCLLAVLGGAAAAFLAMGRKSPGAGGAPKPAHTPEATPDTDADED